MNKVISYQKTEKNKLSVSRIPIILTAVTITLLI